MLTLHTNPYDLPRLSRMALALVSSVITGLIATSLLQWNTVKATVEAPEAIPTRITDTDRDGITDLEELPFETSIYNPDSDLDGMNDGDEVKNGRNPNGEGKLPAPSFTQASTVQDADHDNLSDELEKKLGTDPAHPDTDSDGFPDGLEWENGYDPTGAGKMKVNISIPAIKVNAPLVWTENTEEKTIERDLTRGVIHFPGTAIPGQVGNVFVTGHSSDYFWQKSPYRDVFKKLDKLAIGNEVTFTFTLANGKKYEARYALQEKMIVAPSDRSLLSPTATPTLTLVTCYPIGSNTDRLAWRGTLVQ